MQHFPGMNLKQAIIISERYYTVTLTSLHTRSKNFTIQTENEIQGQTNDTGEKLNKI